MGEEFKEALWWRQDDEEGIIRCLLCPRGCRLREGQTGSCSVRRHKGGRMVSLSYGHPTGFSVDPIEKKPLFHFLPGSQILSFGTLGCTLGCLFCQNWSHSHPRTADAGIPWVGPAEVVTLAKQKGIPAISYTYNEPTVFGEYVADVAVLSRAEGIRNVAVTNGYVTPNARAEIFANIDGVNVDLKGFGDEFYREHCQGRLEPVLNTLEWIANQSGIWLEITTLLIPGLNDADEMIGQECDWILERLGPDVPIHFTAFHPDFKMLNRPRTPAATLARAREIALRKGIHFVYVGNIADPDGQSTMCSQCGERLIERDWHFSREVSLDGSRCGKCRAEIPGVFA